MSDAISISYGQEEISKTGAVDAEFEGISASYTAGGMTVSVGTQTAENANGNAADKDVDYNYLGLSFAF